MLAASNEEARFLRHPISLLTSYLESAHFREQREKKQIQRLQKGIKLGQQATGTSLLDEQDNLKVLLGELSGMK